MADGSDIEYFFLAEDNFGEVVTFLDEDYFQREPLSLGSHVEDKCDSTKGRAAEEVRQLLQSGLSVGVRERKTGRLVGMCGAVIEDGNHRSEPWEPANEFEELYPPYDYVMDQLHGLETAEKLLLLTLLGVQKEFGGRGIAGRLVQKIMAAGSAKGAQVAYTGATNIVSRNIFLKLGFETRFQLDYEDPRFKLDVSRMSGNKACFLMTKKLP